MLHRLLLFTTMHATVVTTVLAQTETPAYQATMMRAAPGRLLQLVEALKTRMPVYQASGEPRPILLRHSQGDQWDLMLLTPIGDLADFFGKERQSHWQAGLRATGFDDEAFGRNLKAWVAWKEELYVSGPPVTELNSAAADAGYFHLEIFQALAGKNDSLRQEREMENEFLRRIGRPTNFVFEKITGAAWDIFTVGFYRDLPHYAEPAKVGADEEEAAARAAGFESRQHIGPYLRQFIAGHHDTIGTVVR